MSHAIMSIFRVVEAALTSSKPASGDASVASRQEVYNSEIASSAGYSSPTITPELSFPSREHSFVTVSSIHNEFVPVSSLTPVQLVDFCVECLSFDHPVLAAKHTREMLRRGFDVITKISDEWSSAPPAPAQTLEHSMMSIQGLADYNRIALYHTLSKLLGHESWLDLEPHPHKFEAEAAMWILRVGPRGLAAGWDDGHTVMEVLYEAEREDRAAHESELGHRDALIMFAKQFRAWNVHMREKIGFGCVDSG